MVYGLDRLKFADLVSDTLYKNRLTYRAAATELGICPSTFTRIKQEKDISLDSFIILISWIKDRNFPEWNWNILMCSLIKDSFVE